jgi:hypothetical protein
VQNNSNFVHKRLNAERDFEIVEIRGLGELPDDVGDAASSALQNSRSALDALAWAVANRTGPPAKPKQVAFPIAASFEEFKERRIQENNARLGSDWLCFIWDAMPYLGGNELLYALHDANNRDKHRSIIRVEARIKPHVTVQAGSEPLSVNLQAMFNPKNGVELGRYPVEMKSQTKIEPILNITFTDIPVVEDEPVVTALQRFSDEAARIISAANILFRK